MPDEVQAAESAAPEAKPEPRTEVRPVIKRKDLEGPKPEPKPAISVREAAAELTARRAQSAPVIKRDFDPDNTNPDRTYQLNDLRSVADDLALTRRVERVESLRAQGMPTADAIATAREEAFGPEPKEPPRIKDDGKSPLTREQAAKLIAQNHRDTAEEWLAKFDSEEARREAREAIAGEKPDAEPKAKVAPPPQQAQPQQDPTQVADRDLLHPQIRDRLQAYEGELASLRHVVAVANNQFDDIRTDEDVVRLSMENPERFQQFKQTFQKMEHLRAQEAHLRDQRLMLEHAARDQEAGKWDAEVIQSLPDVERNNPAAVGELQAGMKNALLSVGLSENDVTALVNGHAKIDIRSPAAQKIIVMAARHIMGHQAAAKKLAAPKPPVQRPGAHFERMSAVDHDVVDLSEQLSKDGNIKTATKLLLARRRAR